MFGIATRLAIVLSVIAAIAAVMLDATSDVSPVMMVIVVASVGFVASWVMTGRVHQHQPIRHRVAVIPLHQRVS
jgi:hypothetical protein